MATAAKKSETEIILEKIKKLPQMDSLMEKGLIRKGSHDANAVLKQHNDARKLVHDGDATSKYKTGVSFAQPRGPDVGPLQYDNEYAAIAQAYAEKCRFHTHSEICGENLNTYDPTKDMLEVTSARINDLVETWIEEGQHYNYSPIGAKIECDPPVKGGFHGKCGHYTQIINERVKKVGCGWSICKNKGGEYWTQLVCSYDACQYTDHYPYITPKKKETEPKEKIEPKKKAKIEKKPPDEKEKEKAKEEKEKQERMKLKEKERQKQMELERKRRMKIEKEKEKEALKKEKEKEKMKEKKKIPEKQHWLQTAGTLQLKEHVKPSEALFEDFGTYYDLNDYYGDYDYFDSYGDAYYIDQSAGDTQKAYEYLVDANYDAAGVGEYYPHSQTDNGWMLSLSLMVNIGLFILLLSAICCVCVMIYGYLLHKLCKSEEDMLRKSRRMSEV